MTLSQLWLPESSQPDFRHTGRKVQGLGTRKRFVSEHIFSLSLCPIFHTLFFFLNFLLQDICFTILLWFLPYISMNQPYVCPLPPETPSQLPPQSHYSRWSENKGLSSLCHTANSHWLYFIYGNVYVSMLLSHTVLVVKNLPVNAGDIRDAGSIPGLGRSPGEGNGNPLLLLPGDSHGQRSLAGYGPQGHKELDMKKRLSTPPSTRCPQVCCLCLHLHCEWMQKFWYIYTMESYSAWKKRTHLSQS